MSAVQSTINSGQELYKRACKLIPGGTQLLSKRPEMLLPERWPAYYSRAKGVSVWDLDGNEYVDAGYHGIGACVLGYGDDDVDEAVIAAIKKGSTSILNCPQEVELAEELVALHPWADMVRFCRSGGESLAIAVRIARASTGRSKVAICGYHGWHDWYLAANLSGDGDRLNGHLLPGLAPNGVAQSLAGTAVPFHYNQINQLEERRDDYKENLAAIVMEPVRSSEPTDGFLEKVRAFADDCGAVLIFDEVTSGFRLNCGGAHLHYGVNPDIAVYAKSISNGYPMGAIIGSREVMEAAQDTFISSTAWTESTGPAASLAVLKKYQRLKVHELQHAAGSTVRQGWQDAAASAGLKLSVSGIVPLSSFALAAHENGSPAEQKTFYVQEMMARGYLTTNSFYATRCHSPEILKSFLDNVADVFADMARKLEDGTLRGSLLGPVIHTGFYRLS